MNINCKTCLYYEDLADQNLQGRGLCRRHAPQRQWELVGRNVINWPIVNGDDWCGEWSNGYCTTKPDAPEAGASAFNDPRNWP